MIDEPEHVNMRILRRLTALMPTGWKPLSDEQARKLEADMNVIVEQEFKSNNEEERYEPGTHYFKREG